MLDANLIFSSEQVINTTEDSTDSVDLGAGTDYLGNAVIPEGSYSGRLRLVIRVGATAFSGGTSVAFKLQDSANDSSFADTEILIAAIAVGTLTAGYLVTSIPIPAGLRRYLKIVYTVVGSPSAGTCNAYLEPM
jgi:hypothetical protein